MWRGLKVKYKNVFEKILDDCAKILGIDKEELRHKLYKQFKIDLPK